MTIRLNNVGKRFNFEWILQHINYTFESGSSYAILGPNGSGKSTLLQMIAASLRPSSGSVDFFMAENKIDPDYIFRNLSFSAPYLELIEEFSLEETINFQKNFKPFKKGITAREVAHLAGMEKEMKKTLKNFSSGMQQRVKLVLALLADVPVVLLDEPTTNLDRSGVEWYLELIKNFSDNRLLVICSNIEREYSFCNQQLNVMEYKS